MRLFDDRWKFSPTDLATFVRCGHAVQLRKRSRNGTLQAFAPPGRSIRADMLARRGQEHEDAYVTDLRLEEKRIVEISRADPAAIDATTAAMRAGADVIVQGALATDPWFGYADFLERVAVPSSLGNWSYEAADTKLSMSVQPYFILQLGIYSMLIETIQESAPTRMHLVLGDGTRHSFECLDYSAYIHHLIRRFGVAFASAEETLPYPVEYCGLCEWNRHCWLHLVNLDHLSLVANIRRDHIKHLHGAGVSTLTALAVLDPTTTIEEIAQPVFERLHHQARLQHEYNQTAQHRYELLDPEERRGFQLIPALSQGDLFFDIEADPFEDLTYLFGMAFDEGGEPSYRCRWAHNAEQERQAFEAVIDFMTQRRRDHPDAHIYHYGAIEVTTLKRLMGRYGTREDEIDDLLRREAFVDLLAVVRQSIRISHPSYSLKKVETFYRSRESEGVIDAGGAIVAYEGWLEEPDQAKLDEIEAYNREDCLSTLELRAWLLRLRVELETARGCGLAWREPRPPEPTREALEQERMETDELSRALLDGLAVDRTTWADTQKARWLLANLLHYHRREDKPKWWAFFDRLKMSPEDLLDDREAIGVLVPTGATRQEKKSIVTAFTFEPQQHKLSLGDRVGDPERLKADGWPSPAGVVETLDNETGSIELRVGGGFAEGALPRAIVPTDFVDTKKIRAALRRYAGAWITSEFQQTRYRAGHDLLFRNPPRIRDQEYGTKLHGAHVDVELVKGLASRLDSTCLFIQGPPGSGKTYVGARVIVDLLQSGQRVGISASSHKAIENMLHEVEQVADEVCFAFRGLKCSTSKEHVFTSKLTQPCIVDIEHKFPRGEKPEPTDAAFRLVAGTQWFFSGPEHEQQFDVLLIDEAGQMPLADAIACSTAATSVILLGDPLQLAQVSQGTHPDGCEVSVLAHLLGNHATIPPERGGFLERSWRMHPDVCRFISEVVYGGRLESHESCSLRHIDAPGLSGTGLRYKSIDHEGNSQESREEAIWIAEMIALMLQGGSFTDENRARRPLRPDDLMVVTPYNAQASAIRNELQKRALSIPVGTVDKFQGQEAPVVFFSMATSSGEDIPRSLDFLFSRNRLNVAISRAQCLAIVVASPKLLDVDCRTVEQMKLVNALCRFVEMATPV